MIELLLTAGESEQALATATAELERVSGREEQLYTPALVGVAVRRPRTSDAGAPLSMRRRAPHGLVVGLPRRCRAPDRPCAPGGRASRSATAPAARRQPSSGTASRASWDQLQHPYRAAYARVREAEALLAATATARPPHGALSKALTVADALGATPLAEWADGLVARKRLRRAVVRRLESAGPAERLTRREREVLGLVAEGRTNRQIGGQLHITEGTAALHVSRILGKLEVKTRGQAAAIARQAAPDQAPGDA